MNQMQPYAHVLFQEIVECLKNPVLVFKDIEACLAQMGKELYVEYEEHMNEWVFSYNKVSSNSTTLASTFIFKDHRVVIAYNSLDKMAQYANICVSLMKDFPKPNLSIRKAMFLYDASLDLLIPMDNEISKP